MNCLASFFCLVSLSFLFAYANIEKATEVTQPIEKADKYRYLLEYIYNQKSTDKYYSYIVKMNKYTFIQVDNDEKQSFYYTMTETDCLKEHVYKEKKIN